jgi:hypothetical protein
MTRMPLYSEPHKGPTPAGSQRSAHLLRAGALLLALLFVVSCSGQSDAEDDFLPAGFDVQQDLLSEQMLIDSTFFIRAPLTWADIDTAAFSTVRKAIRQDTAAFFDLEPIRILSSPDGASCIISRVVCDPFGFYSLNEDFKQSLELSSQSENVVRGSFSVNDIKVVQYRVVTPDVIAFKLFCLVDTRYYQIDYLLPADIYQNEIRKVESSVGSITSKSKRKGVTN